jgi:hypothetical protein
MLYFVQAAMDAAGLKIVDFVDIGINATLTQLLGHAGYFHAGRLSFGLLLALLLAAP